MNHTKSFALQMHREAIVSDLVVDNIIDKLLSKFIIDQEDKGLIDKESNEKDKARCLLDILVNKNDETYDAFKEILIPDYSWLAKLLEFNNSSEWIQTIQQDALTLGGVPREPPHYVERKDILKIIQGKLLNLKRNNFLMLHGMPGSGKSCLARSAICDRDVLNKMANRVYWCNVGECTTKELIQQHLYRLYSKVQLDIVQRDKRASTILMSEKLEFLHDTLKTLFTRSDLRDALLVLDDVRDSQTIEIFDLGCKILLTSKNMEVLHHINSNDLNVIPVKDFTEIESVQLFCNCMDIQMQTLTSQQITYLQTIHNLCRGLPMVVALMGGQLKLSYKMEESRIERMQDCIQRLRTEFYNSDKIFQAIDICIRDLTEELRLKFENMVVFLEDVNVPSSVLQLLWGVSKYTVEEIMTELMNRSLVLGQFNVGNKEYVYGLHDLLLAHLKNNLKKEHIQQLHRELINKYRKKCGGNFSKLPNDNYIYSYLGYHFEESNEPLPNIYLDLNFIGAKIRATSSADVLLDFKRYEENIIKDDGQRKAQLKEMEEFVKECGYDLYRYPDLSIVQLALTWRQSGYMKAFALDIIKSKPDRLFMDVWCKEKGAPRPQILELSSVPLVACFAADNNQILVGYGDGVIQMWDLNYYRVRARFEQHTRPVRCLKVSPSDENFVSISEDGEAYLWNIPNTFSLSTSITNGSLNGSPSPVVRQRPWNSLHETDASKFSHFRHFQNDEVIFKYACYSNNGEYLCLCSANGFINIHNVLTGNTEAQSNVEIDDIISCCFYSKNYVMLASIDNIWLFDMKSELIGKFQCNASSIHSLAAKYGEVLLVTPTTIGHFHSQQVGALVENIQCTCAGITPDGDILVVGNHESTTVYEVKFDINGELEALEMMHVISDQSGVVTFVDAYQNGPCVYVLLSNDKEPQIKIWSLQAGDLSPDYNKIARRLPIFDCVFDPPPVTPEPRDSLKSLSKQLSNHTIVDPSKLGNILGSYAPSSPRHININYQLVVADSSHRLQIQRGHTVTNTEQYENRVTCTKISACGSLVAYGLDNGYVYAYEIKSRKSEKVLKLPACACYIDFFENLTLIAADDAGTLMVWTDKRQVKLQGDIKASKEKENNKMNGHNNPTEKIIKCFTIDRYIASISENCSVKLWDIGVADHRLVSVLWGSHSTHSKAACASLRNKKLVLGQDDGSFMFLHLDTDKLKGQCKELNKLEKPIQCLDLSPDGKIAAFGLVNGDITLWSLECNVELCNLKLHKCSVKHLSFAPHRGGDDPLILLSTSDTLAWWNITYCLDRHKQISRRRKSRTRLKIEPSNEGHVGGLDLKNIANPDQPWMKKTGPDWRPELMMCIKLQGKYATSVVSNSLFTAFVTVDESGQFYLMRLK